MDGSGGEEQIQEVEEIEVVGDTNDTAPQHRTAADMGEDGDAEGVVVNNSKGLLLDTPRRIRIGKASEERSASPSRVPALEASTRAYADRKVGIVVNPALGTSFDSVEEAYEFYNLYSWETGFGVRKIVARREYVARHVKKDSMDKWCKNEFVVQVSEVAGEFKCECKMFEHFGMVCSHSLKVMVWLGLQEVPAEHVLKRWTRDARDILPLEFLRYQKDQGPLKYSLRRHNNLHFFALKLLDSATATWMHI